MKSQENLYHLDEFAEKKWAAWLDESSKVHVFGDERMATPFGNFQPRRTKAHQYEVWSLTWPWLAAGKEAYP